MAGSVESPFFGLLWIWAGLLLVAALMVLTLCFGVALGRRGWGWRPGYLILAALGCGVWTFFTLGAPVTVPIPEDPQGAECVHDPFGEGGGAMNWDGDCGRAFERHLWGSLTPTALATGAMAAAIPTVIVRRRRPTPPRD